MPDRAEPPSSWTVGELSEATGLSVRVLRHWEQLGLIAPGRTPSGHRRYGPDDVTRLYQAMALRRTGLGLRRIGALLDRDDPDPVATLRAHLGEIDQDLRRRTQLRDRLCDVLLDAAPDPAGPPVRTDPDPQLLMKVIETMTMFEQYVHGYREQENTRLHDQAGTLVDLIHDGVTFDAGSRVLEVGCGVGAQTVELARRHPDSHITSVDVSPASLDRARRRAAAAGVHNVEFAVADVYDLPHTDGALAPAYFDHVFVCFVLEHLPRPMEALERLKRMLRPHGGVTVVEGDHGSTYFHPDSAAARAAIDCQVTLQHHAGGDALIGRTLYPLLTQAGFAQVRVEPRMIYVDASRPHLVEGFTRKTFVAMINGVREPAVAAGLTTPEAFDRGVADLERTTAPDGVFCYTFFRAMAVAADLSQSP